MLISKILILMDLLLIGHVLHMLTSTAEYLLHKLTSTAGYFLLAVGFAEYLPRMLMLTTEYFSCMLT
ncbi:hypothetical protein GGF32_007159 [Allomyces javanicus]|nr:hypothetical protein GGF32_007159 [Allomyces javanicus]